MSIRFAGRARPLANRLIRLAAFQNPEFYKKQAMRFSVWDELRVIGCAENYPVHIARPRGCLNAVLDLLRIPVIVNTKSGHRERGGRKMCWEPEFLSRVL